MQVLAEKSPQKATIPLCKNGQNTTTTRNSRKICLFSVSGSYGARYLDPRTSRWISADPAVGDYIPQMPANDDARKRNQNLPGQGGVYNVVNLHVYHYAGNNPIKYTDPDGKWPGDWIAKWMAKSDPQGGKSISPDAPQRRFGYSGFYEGITSNNVVCNVDSVRFTFKNTDGKSTQLWLWKGDYNLVDSETWESGGGIKFEWHMGGEIGTYSGSGPWAPAQENALLSMSYSLFEKGSDTPFLTRNSKGEYWTNGFASGQSGNPGNIIMQGQLKFRSVAAAKAFEQSVGKERYYPGVGSSPSVTIERQGRIVNFTFE